MVGYPYQQEMEVGEKLTEIIDQVIEKYDQLSLKNNPKEKDGQLSLENKLKEEDEQISCENKPKEKDDQLSLENKHKEKDEVELILEEIIQKVCEKTAKKKKKITKKPSKDEVVIEENIKSEPECPHIKGILKPRRCHCCTNNHVDFIHAPVMIRAYDETKDFTADIQFVEEHPKKIVSYKKLFAEQRKAENSSQEIQDR